LFLAGGANEEEFDGVFEGGVEKCMLVIIEGLNESGFLGQKIDTQELKALMDKAKKEALKQG